MESYLGFVVGLCGCEGFFLLSGGRKCLSDRCAGKQAEYDCVCEKWCDNREHSSEKGIGGGDEKEKVECVCGRNRREA